MQTVIPRAWVLVVSVQVVCVVGVKRSAVLPAKQMPMDYVNSTTTVNTACQCKMQCFTSPKCQCVTAEVVSDESILCHVSYQDVDYTSLVDSDNSESVTFYWRDYEQMGTWYYRVVKEEAGSVPPRQVCEREGGQLMVAHTKLLKIHLKALFLRHDLQRCWVNLRAPVDIQQNITDDPSWKFSNGYSVKETTFIQSSKAKCFAASFDPQSKDVVVFTNEGLTCDTAYPYICQRHH